MSDQGSTGDQAEKPSPPPPPPKRVIREDAPIPARRDDRNEEEGS